VSYHKYHAIVATLLEKGFKISQQKTPSSIKEKCTLSLEENPSQIDWV
jgi:hypothetical protein